MADNEPLVGIIMGSQSDWSTMKNAAETLDKLDIANEMRVISAHRTPHRLTEYATEARVNGLKVLIAGAGMAAALPGAADHRAAGGRDGPLRVQPGPRRHHRRGLAARAHGGAEAVHRAQGAAARVAHPGLHLRAAAQGLRLAELLRHQEMPEQAVQPQLRAADAQGPREPRGS